MVTSTTRITSKSRTKWIWLKCGIMTDSRGSRVLWANSSFMESRCCSTPKEFQFDQLCQPRLEVGEQLNQPLLLAQGFFWHFPQKYFHPLFQSRGFTFSEMRAKPFQSLELMNARLISAAIQSSGRNIKHQLTDRIFSIIFPSTSCVTKIQLTNPSHSPSLQFNWQIATLLCVSIIKALLCIAND